jgi:hypothetical protein
MSNSVALALSRVGKRKGDGRGHLGLFIEGRGMRRGLGFSWIGSGGWEGVGQGRDGIQRRGMKLTGGPGCQRWDKKSCTLSGNNLGGPWASFGAGPNGSPAAFYSFYICFSFSLF